MRCRDSSPIRKVWIEIMYAISENVPFIVKKENTKSFLEGSAKQKGIADSKAKMFGKSDFDFKEDEKGFISVKIDMSSFKKGVEKQ